MLAPQLNAHVEFILGFHSCPCQATIHTSLCPHIPCPSSAVCIGTPLTVSKARWGPVTPTIPGCLPALHCSFQNRTFPRGCTPTWQVLFQLLFIELLENSASRKGKKQQQLFPSSASSPCSQLCMRPVHEGAAGLGHSSSPLTPLCLLHSSTSMINWIHTFFLLLFATGTANQLSPTWAQEVPHQESPCSRPLDTEQQGRVWSCYSFAAIGGKKKSTL